MCLLLHSECLIHYEVELKLTTIYTKIHCGIKALFIVQKKLLMRHTLCLYNVALQYIVSYIHASCHFTSTIAMKSLATSTIWSCLVCLQDVFEDTLLYQGLLYPGKQALTLQQLEQFVANVCAVCPG